MTTQTKKIPKEKEEGVRYALKAAQEDEFAKKIHLDWLDLVDEELIPLLDHPGLHNRRAINLNQNNLTDVSLEALASRSEITSNLQFLQAYKNKFTQEGLRKFIDNCPRLLSVEFEKLNEDILETLRDRIRGVKKTCR